MCLVLVALCRHVVARCSESVAVWLCVSCIGVYMPHAATTRIPSLSNKITNVKYFHSNGCIGVRRQLASFYVFLDIVVCHRRRASFNIIVIHCCCRCCFLSSYVFLKCITVFECFSTVFVVCLLLFVAFILLLFLLYSIHSLFVGSSCVCQTIY